MISTSDFELDGFCHPDLLESEFKSSTIRFVAPHPLSLLFGSHDLVLRPDPYIKKLNVWMLTDQGLLVVKLFYLSGYIQVFGGLIFTHGLWIERCEVSNPFHAFHPIKD